MIEVFVVGVGLRGPGLAGWEAFGRRCSPAARRYPRSRRRCRRRRPPSWPPTSGAAPGRWCALPSPSRRRRPTWPDCAAAEMTSVFASANGDGALVHAILETLADPEPQVSPTQFHNSVHNAPAGTGRSPPAPPVPATCLGCHDATARRRPAARRWRSRSRRTGRCCSASTMRPCRRRWRRAAPDTLRLRRGAGAGTARAVAARWHRLRLDWHARPTLTASAPRLPALRGAARGRTRLPGCCRLLEALAAGTGSRPCASLAGRAGRRRCGAMPGPEPHPRADRRIAGAMCLLDAVRRWDATAIVCAARSHLDPRQPAAARGPTGGRLRHRVRPASGRAAWRAGGRGRAARGRAPGGAAGRRTPRRPARRSRLRRAGGRRRGWRAVMPAGSPMRSGWRPRTASVWSRGAG